MNIFERLEELTDAAVEITGTPGHNWLVLLRPRAGGFPLVRGEGYNLPEAIKQAIERWETK